MSARSPVRHSTQQVESTARSPRSVRPEAFDREALAQFASVRRAAWRLTRNVPEAEDLVQETYTRALRAFRNQDFADLTATAGHKVHVSGMANGEQLTLAQIVPVTPPSGP